MKDVRPYHKYDHVKRNYLYNCWKKIKLHTQEFKARYGRTLTVCERWKDFKNFVDDMGPRPVGKIFTRRRYFEGYTPENCYWTTRSQAALAKRPEYRDPWVGKTIGKWEVLSFCGYLINKRCYNCRCTRCKVEKRVTGHRLRTRKDNVRCWSCKPLKKDRHA